MKKLQNDVTTLEQSKRLIELGVPADSANCYMDENGSKFFRQDKLDYGLFSGQTFFEYFDGIFFPCWSVGRLMEIMALCYKFDLPDSGSIQVYATNFKKRTVVDVLISDIERFINKIDFSKLEEEK